MIGSPSADGDVGVAAVIGADAAAGADGITDGDVRPGTGVFVTTGDSGISGSTGTTSAGAGVIILTSTGDGVGVPGQSSRARGAVETRPIAAPHVAQNRCPGGFVALHAGQIAGPSALNDLENLNDGASGR